jgi:hypothetical protein
VLPGTGQEPAASLPMKDAPTDQPSARPQGPEMPQPLVDRLGNEGFEMPWWSWMAMYLAAAGTVFYHAVSTLGLGRPTEGLKTRVNKRMKRLHELAKKSDHRGVGVHSTNLIYMVLGELAGHGGASRQLDVLLNEGPPSLRRELGASLKEILTLSESLAFAPEAMVAQLSQKASLKKFLGELEKTLLAAVALGNPHATKEAKN